MKHINQHITKGLISACTILIADPQRIFIELNPLPLRASKNSTSQAPIAQWVDLGLPDLTLLALGFFVSILNLEFLVAADIKITLAPKQMIHREKAPCIVTQRKKIGPAQ